MKHLTTTLVLILFQFSALGFAEQDYRVGILAGTMTPQGELADQTSGLTYGGTFGYMFADDLEYQFDMLSNSDRDYSHTNISMLVNWYYKNYRFTYLDLKGGIALNQNSLKSGTETLKGEAVGLVFGAGLSFDIGKSFVAGFDFRYNFTTGAKTTNSSSQEVTVVDSSYSLLSRIAYVF